MTVHMAHGETLRPQECTLTASALTAASVTSLGPDLAAGPPGRPLLCLHLASAITQVPPGAPQS